jgi:hypothetical protein
MGGSPRGQGCRSWGGRDGRRGGSTTAGRSGRGGSGNGEDDAGFGPQANWGGLLGLKKLLERLAGGEREQAHELEAAAAMAAEGARVARGGGTWGLK